MGNIIKFEGEHIDLKELHHFLYSKNNNLDIQEEYKSTPGVNKAPDVTAIIVTTISTAAAGVLTTWIKEYFNYKKTKLNQIEISQKKDGAFKKINSVEDIDEQ